MLRRDADDSQIHQLTPSDVEGAVSLSTAAGWNQTSEDWCMLTKLSPNGCFGLECGGTLVATTTLMAYGEQLAWLGMVLTHPEYRSRGFATKLVKRALHEADKNNIRTVKLDATDQGRLLYQDLGFRDEQVIERWARPMQAPSGKSNSAPGMPDLELDFDAFGADRSLVLKALNKDALNNRAFSSPTGDGFVMWRRGLRASYLGPCVARSTPSAKLLIEHCLRREAPGWFWDLLPANHTARALAAEFGFRLDRRLMRMVRGKDLRGEESSVYATGGFELG